MECILNPIGSADHPNGVKAYISDHYNLFSRQYNYEKQWKLAVYIITLCLHTQAHAVLNTKTVFHVSFGYIHFLSH